MIRSSGFLELCPGEINDFILELVQNCLNNIPPDVHNRRRDLCEEILKHNKPVGERAKAKEVVTSTLKDWSARKDQIKRLENAGFSVVKGRTHFKMRFNNSAYQLTLSASPSDHRAGHRTVSDALLAFF
jgi:hypothetical protein